MNELSHRSVEVERTKNAGLAPSSSFPIHKSATVLLWKRRSDAVNELSHRSVEASDTQSATTRLWRRTLCPRQLLSLPLLHKEQRKRLRKLIRA